MTAELRLELPYPPSANAYWRAAPGRGMVPSDEARRYKTQVQLAAAAERVRPLIGAVDVTLRIRRPRRAGDLDNSLKVLLDALREIAFLDDDQVVHIDATRVDGEAPGVALRLVGERFATPAEALDHRIKRAVANQKRRATLAANRRAAR